MEHNRRSLLCCVGRPRVWGWYDVVLGCGRFNGPMQGSPCRGAPLVPGAEVRFWGCPNGAVLASRVGHRPFTIHCVVCKKKGEVGRS